MNILKSPTTVKLLAVQIIKACDGYISLELSEKQFRELLFHYASQHGTKLFSSKGINPTIVNKIGKKRMD